MIGHAPVVGPANRHFDTWLAAHRTPNRTEASLIGSIVAGGVVLPIVAGLVAAGVRRASGSGGSPPSPCSRSRSSRPPTARTTLVFHEHRPRVHRLENLPVDASYPSGHTAASIAVYGGLVLLLTSRIRSPAVRAVAWSIAVAIPIYVALSRMYRGMHYPLDVTGGALVGIAALCVVVFACRAAGAADRHRTSTSDEGRRRGAFR